MKLCQQPLPMSRATKNRVRFCTEAAKASGKASPTNKDMLTSVLSMLEKTQTMASPLSSLRTQ